MVRKRTTLEPEREDYERAFKAITETGLTYREAATAFQVPLSTLARYVKKGSVPQRITQGRFKNVFSVDEEKQIVDFLIDLSETFQGMTRGVLGVLAYTVAVESGKDHPFVDKTGKPKGTAGRGWIRGFLKRHRTELSARTATPLTQQRISGFNPNSVKIFHDKLAKLMDKYKFTPDRIYNVDETGLTIVPLQRQKLIAALGAKVVSVMVPCERGQLVTMICCMSASGEFIPPMFIFRGNNSYEAETEKGPSGSISSTSSKGWSTHANFLEWLTHFYMCMQHGEGDTLLIMDNASSHISLETIRFCRNHRIHILSIPSHTSHKLQPLDVGFFSPMKLQYSEAVKRWRMKNGMRIPAVQNIPEMIKSCYNDSKKPDTAKNAFHKTSIWDLQLEKPNPNAFGDKDFKAWRKLQQRQNIQEEDVAGVFEENVDAEAMLTGVARPAATNDRVLHVDEFDVDDVYLFGELLEEDDEEEDNAATAREGIEAADVEGERYEPAAEESGDEEVAAGGGNEETVDPEDDNEAAGQAGEEQDQGQEDVTSEMGSDHPWAVILDEAGGEERGDQQHQFNDFLFDEGEVIQLMQSSAPSSQEILVDDDEGQEENMQRQDFFANIASRYNLSASHTASAPSMDASTYAPVEPTTSVGLPSPASASVAGNFDLHASYQRMYEVQPGTLPVKKRRGGRKRQEAEEYTSEEYVRALEQKEVAKMMKTKKRK